MLNREDNELLTRIGPGTPMGSMLREYWVPACRSAKLEADGAPARIRLFGENFVAFRATDGRVGFFNEGCPHRCASLALARNEGNGLRCIFHGWKFDVSGKCVDTPTEPEDRRATFAERVPVKHYAVREAGGLVWVYLGKNQANPPRFHDFEFTRLPDSHVSPRRGVIHCNWLQGLEALLDSAHVTFLHASGLGSSTGKDFYKKESDYMLSTGAPVFEFIQKPYGFREGALRDQPDGNTYARIREVAFPFASFIPAPPGGFGLVCFSIPIDDEWTAQWYVGFDTTKPFDRQPRPITGKDSGDPDFFNSDMGDIANMWHQDRAAMKEGHWTGILGRGNAYEDFIVQESMGPIVDRSQEFLGTCDVVIVRSRKILLDAIHQYQKDGTLSFTGPEIDFSRIRAISFAYPKGDDWKKIDPFNPPVQQAA
ncbi:MAG TPA: Rieske 2Fe-2S domain-containing protein [Stellaceae bacterium]|jgi:phenylpropionate dioxygenase-like ring-hydroxylating dioxygenase large terminal subunit|nr:Rieske 2Fe-2S domain-containing protein [Stellaceae bacterium]